MTKYRKIGIIYARKSKKLCENYNELTDSKAEPIIMSVTTYAREMPNIVAFAPALLTENAQNISLKNICL